MLGEGFPLLGEKICLHAKTASQKQETKDFRHIQKGVGCLVSREGSKSEC